MLDVRNIYMTASDAAISRLDGLDEENSGMKCGEQG